MEKNGLQHYRSCDLTHETGEKMVSEIANNTKSAFLTKQISL